MRIENLQYLFNNLKNGDFLGFYHKPWYFLFSRLIFWVTGQKMDHVAGVFDVKKSDYGNIIYFTLGEQMTSGRRIIKYSISRYLVDGKIEYLLDSRFKKKYVNLYYLPNFYIIDEDQNNKLANFWMKKVKYEFSQLFFVINWVYRLFGDKNKIYDRNCSTAVRESMREIGVIDAKFNDAVTSPYEFVQLSYVKEIVKIEA